MKLDKYLPKKQADLTVFVLDPWGVRAPFKSALKRDKACTFPKNLSGVF